MRQVWIPRIGGPEVLEVREGPDPKPGEGEILIDVAASGINFADIMARMGLYPDAPKLPTVVGYEVSGKVAALGPGVDHWEIGERVVALTRFGGYSDKVAVPAVQAAPLPREVDDLRAAAIPVQYMTAWVMLIHLGNLKPGNTVLVHAAGGGVGQAAVQICRWKGARIIGTASAGKHERLRAAGVDHCIDYRTQDFEPEVMRITEGRGVEIVLDAVGGKSFAKSYRCLANLGRLFMFGASSFAPGTKRNLWAALKGLWGMPKYKPFDLMDKNRGVFGVNLGHLWEERVLLGDTLRQLVELIQDGTFDPHVDATFDFDHASDAHAYIQARKNFGKVLLTPT